MSIEQRLKTVITTPFFNAPMLSISVVTPTRIHFSDAQEQMDQNMS